MSERRDKIEKKSIMHRNYFMYVLKIVSFTQKSKKLKSKMKYENFAKKALTYTHTRRVYVAFKQQVAFSQKKFF